jgi:hypothetical protein
MGPQLLQGQGERESDFSQLTAVHVVDDRSRMTGLGRFLFDRSCVEGGVGLAALTRVDFENMGGAENAAWLENVLRALRRKGISKAQMQLFGVAFLLGYIVRMIF